MTSRVVLDIDLDMIAENFRKIAQSVTPLGTIVVLKADAYGLGMRPIAQVLAKAGACGIATAELSEALIINDLGLPVMILGTVLPDELEPALQAGIHIPIAGLEEARAASQAAQRLGITARGHIALDTGMGRVGIQLSDARSVIPKISNLPHLALEGLYSHFPAAGIRQDSDTLHQIKVVKHLHNDLYKSGIKIPSLHIANSNAINNFLDSACVPPFTHVRAGNILYGLPDTVRKRQLHLRTALTLRAKLAQVRTLPAGSTIGYGRTFVCQYKMKIGTVAAGYADGIPFALSNRGSLLIRGQLCPIVGRVSMDYTMVSLDMLPSAEAGDDVICLGGEHANAIRVASWATIKGTNACEITCSFGPRVKRRYLPASSLKKGV